jgi:hypothetical protein
MKLTIRLSVAMFLLFLACKTFAITQKDTIYAYEAKTVPVIDGKSTEACWKIAKWWPIDQIWIPYNGKMTAADFTGRYKVSWDKDYLYLFVEVTDDVLSDVHQNRISDYWFGDIVEVFIDENRSKGDHKCNYNAFAYHVSPTGYVNDYGTTCSGIFLNDNLKLKVDTISDHVYNWEFAIKIYSDKFTTTDPEASRLTLAKRKLMGLSLAYCDNDGNNKRDNFIGSMEWDGKIEPYITADNLGTCYLVEEGYVPPTPTEVRTSRIENEVNIHPNPVENILNISSVNNLDIVNIFSITGATVATYSFNKENRNEVSLDVSRLKKGLYFLEVIAGETNSAVQKIILL